MERQAAAKVQNTPARSKHLQAQPTRSAAPAHPLLALQRSIGNQAVQRLLGSPYIQTKLHVSTPGDPFEQEADRVADTVMRMPVSMKRESTFSLSESQPIHVQRSCAACAVGEPCSKCGKERTQRKAAHGSSPGASAGVSSHLAALRGGGQHLPSSIRAFFEPRFNRDFSQVRVHTDRLASESASAIQARAFTSGQDIVFGHGEYAPETSAGQRLLAHELTHVVQQGGTTAIAPDLSSESASKPITPVGTGHIQRDWLDDVEAAVSETYDSAASAVGDAFDTVTSAVSAGAREIANEVEAATTTVSNVGQAVGSYASDVGKTLSGDPEKTRANLIGQVNAARQKVQNANPDAVTADASQIGAMNQHISSLNAVLPQTAAAIPVVAPAIGIGLGEAIMGVLTSIAVVLGISVGWLIAIIAVIILAIIALIIYLFRDTTKFPDPVTKADPKDKPDDPPPFPPLPPFTSTKDIEDYEEDSGCDSKHPDLTLCGDLELPPHNFTTPGITQSAAHDSLVKELRGRDQGSKLNFRNPKARGQVFPCFEQGLHTNVFNPSLPKNRQNIGSINCCPCCQPTPTEPLVEGRCKFTRKSGT